MALMTVWFLADDQRQLARKLVVRLWGDAEDELRRNTRATLQERKLEHRVPVAFAAALACSNIGAAFVPEVGLLPQLPFKFAGKMWRLYQLTAIHGAHHARSIIVGRIAAAAHELNLTMIGPHPTTGYALVADQAAIDQDVVARQLKCRLIPATLEQLFALPDR